MLYMHELVLVWGPSSGMAPGQEHRCRASPVSEHARKGGTRVNRDRVASFTILVPSADAEAVGTPDGRRAAVCQGSSPGTACPRAPSRYRHRS